MAADPTIHVVAGPNGAGKTTFAHSHLIEAEGCTIFLDADRLARRLDPAGPLSVALPAGRLMLAAIGEAVERGETFAFETTLAGRNYARRIPSWQERGFHVRLHFLSLTSPDVAVERVLARARQGGHSLPANVIRRRFAAGRRNFHELYRTRVSSWVVYDASRFGDPVAIDEGANE